MFRNQQLFVYGTLRRDFDHAMYQYIGKYFHFAGHGKINGVLYDLGEYPGAIPSRGEHYITGELYVVNEPDEFSYAIAQLDDYEGTDPADGAPLYRREQATVFTDSGTTEAWVYWYNGFVDDKPVIISGDILGYWKEQGKA